MYKVFMCLNIDLKSLLIGVALTSFSVPVVNWLLNKKIK